jgi:hypothetical protein
MRRLGLLLLAAVTGCHAALNQQTDFLAWHRRELQDRGWVESLLADERFVPPSQLWFGEHGFRRKPILPPGWEWDNALALKVYHRGAKYGIRRRHANGSGQQAVYDRCGRLITHGPSAGTPDKVSPRTSFRGHLREDVRPYKLARRLDRWCGGDWFRALYLQARPPAPGK